MAQPPATIPRAAQIWLDFAQAIRAPGASNASDIRNWFRVSIESNIDPQFESEGKETLYVHAKRCAEALAPNLPKPKFELLGASLRAHLEEKVRLSFGRVDPQSVQDCYNWVLNCRARCDHRRSRSKNPRGIRRRRTNWNIDRINVGDLGDIAEGAGPSNDQPGSEDLAGTGTGDVLDSGSGSDTESGAEGEDANDAGSGTETDSESEAWSKTYTWSGTDAGSGTEINSTPRLRPQGYITRLRSSKLVARNSSEATGPAETPDRTPTPGGSGFAAEEGAPQPGRWGSPKKGTTSTPETSSPRLNEAITLEPNARRPRKRCHPQSRRPIQSSEPQSGRGRSGSLRVIDLTGEADEESKPAKKRQRVQELPASNQPQPSIQEVSAGDQFQFSARVTVEGEKEPAFLKANVLKLGEFNYEKFDLEASKAVTTLTGKDPSYFNRYCEAVITGDVKKGDDQLETHVKNPDDWEEVEVNLKYWIETLKVKDVRVTLRINYTPLWGSGSDGAESDDDDTVISLATRNMSLRPGEEQSQTYPEVTEEGQKRAPEGRSLKTRNAKCQDGDAAPKAWSSKAKLPHQLKRKEKSNQHSMHQQPTHQIIIVPQLSGQQQQFPTSVYIPQGYCQYAQALEVPVQQQNIVATPAQLRGEGGPSEIRRAE